MTTKEDTSALETKETQNENKNIENTNDKDDQVIVDKKEPNFTFIKYSAIKNISNELLENFPYNEKYVVEEKIHGCNFSFNIIEYGSEHKIICGKRAGFLDQNDKFYNYDHVLKKYGKYAEFIFDDLKTRNNNIVQVSIHGELIGGGYFNDKGEININPNVSLIQKEVLYTNDIDFIAFDITCFMEDGTRDILSVDDRNNLLNCYRFKTSPILFSGNLNSCIRFCKKNLTFVTVVPKLYYNLPVPKNNLAEGLIIKPIECLRDSHGRRIIAKVKNPKFAEVPLIPPKEVEKPQPPDPKVVYLMRIARGYFNNNRLNSIISQNGELTVDNSMKYVGLLCNDVTTDLSDDFIFTQTYDQLNEIQKKDLRKHYSVFAKDIIDKRLKNKK